VLRAMGADNCQFGHSRLLSGLPRVPRMMGISRHFKSNTSLK